MALLQGWSGPPGVGLGPLPSRILSIFLQAAFPWLMTFGLMGLFRRVCSVESPTLRYLSDSAYWLYLAHLPMIIAAQYVVRDWPIPALAKFLLIVVGVDVLPVVDLSGPGALHLAGAFPERAAHPARAGWCACSRRVKQDLESRLQAVRSVFGSALLLVDGAHDRHRDVPERSFPARVRRSPFPLRGPVSSAFSSSMGYKPVGRSGRLPPAMTMTLFAAAVDAGDLTLGNGRYSEQAPADDLAVPDSRLR